MLSSPKTVTVIKSTGQSCLQAIQNCIQASGFDSRSRLWNESWLEVILEYSTEPKYIILQLHDITQPIRDPVASEAHIYWESVRLLSRVFSHLGTEGPRYLRLDESVNPLEMLSVWLSNLATLCPTTSSTEDPFPCEDCNGCLSSLITFVSTFSNSSSSWVSSGRSGIRSWKTNPTKFYKIRSAKSNIRNNTEY